MNMKKKKQRKTRRNNNSGDNIFLCICRRCVCIEILFNFLPSFCMRLSERKRGCVHNTTNILSIYYRQGGAFGISMSECSVENVFIRMSLTQQKCMQKITNKMKELKK